MFRLRTKFFNFRNSENEERMRGKALYASAIGRGGKANLEKIITSFGTKDFDYLIFVYDDTELTEAIFNCCDIIYGSGLKWQFGKKYITPDYCSKYDYIFYWDHDILVGDFSAGQFLDIMKRNNLEMAQPSLTRESFFSHSITLSDPLVGVGRYTDFVEVMIPVFSYQAWVKYWDMLEKGYNYWGWGYDFFAKSICGFTNMGTIDCQSVTHTDPITSMNTTAPEDFSKFCAKHAKHRKSQRISYSILK